MLLFSWPKEHEMVVKIVWRLHDHAINNAYVIYQGNNPSEKPLTILQFRLKLAHAMTEALVGTRVIPSRVPVSDKTRLIGKHFPYHSSNRKRCVVCAYKKVRVRNIYPYTCVSHILDTTYRFLYLNVLHLLVNSY